MSAATSPPTAACPSCGEPTAIDVRYCEACGAELAADPVAAVSEAVAAPTPGPVPSGARCTGCGADPAAVDGYCAHCGMKQPDPYDHVEVDLGPLASVTDRGRQHHRNEDACAIARVGRPDGSVQILVVCDGVSSTSDSHLAARGAARAACDHLEHAAREPEFDATTVGAALQGAVDAAQDAARRVPGSGGETPSCTFVATVVASAGGAGGAAAGDVIVATAWLGDSRAYLVAGGAPVPLSTDDSWAGEAIAAGADPATAYADPRAHSITRWLGIDAGDVVAHLDLRTVPAVGRVLLCSDGLWNYAASPDELHALLTARPGLTPLALGRSLTQFALEAGGHDNITVVVADLDQ